MECVRPWVSRGETGAGPTFTLPWRQPEGPALPLPKEKVCVISPLTGESAPKSGDESPSAGGSAGPMHGGDSRSKPGMGRTFHARNLALREPSKNGHAACRGGERLTRARTRSGRGSQGACDLKSVSEKVAPCPLLQPPGSPMTAPGLPGRVGGETAEGVRNERSQELHRP